MKKTWMIFVVLLPAYLAGCAAQEEYVSSRPAAIRTLALLRDGAAVTARGRTRRQPRRS